MWPLSLNWCWEGLAAYIESLEQLCASFGLSHGLRHKNPRLTGIDALPPEKREMMIKKFSTKGLAYENCIMLSKAGELLCHTDRNKVEWYLNRNIAEKVRDEPLTIRLLFEHKKSDQDAGERFYSEQKINRCVVCGEEEHYLRFRVVPACYRYGIWSLHATGMVYGPCMLQVWYMPPSPGVVPAWCRCGICVHRGLVLDTKHEMVPDISDAWCHQCMVVTTGIKAWLLPRASRHGCYHGHQGMVVTLPCIKAWLLRYHASRHGCWCHQGMVVTTGIKAWLLPPPWLLPTC
ncbi:hypothetical protein DUNSADRAFT_10486 [Dunaliella salina]|uniref:Uncharacterized protein n=1 Tax=Dunaliella salina TaxID=3046 RepID=A0ABQ7GF66_DUNSA|nr:hypothetical protein DUNSADRAFT_10486 [Dunaliella salina]|eukprot:KAF5833248.1 hypothetical protein DUNSADRAFT_10486 [Dunaliella salina]